jgi:hypothetical protein
MSRLKLFVILAVLLIAQAGYSATETDLNLGYVVSYTNMTTGPSTQGLFGVYSAVYGSGGEIYFTTINQGLGVYVLDGGVVTPITCNQRHGYRDGPAAIALFNPGKVQSGYPDRHILSINASGHLFIADGYNYVLRRIYINGSGEWQVETYAGDPDGDDMESGETYGIDEVKLPYMSSHVDVNGDIWLGGASTIAKIDVSESTVSLITPTNPNIDNSVMAIDSDSSGNIYYLPRAYLDGSVVKIDTGNNFTVYVQYTYQSAESTWDGPYATAAVHAPTHLLATSGGVVYEGGGDEICLRKADSGYFSTFQTDSTWEQKIDDDVGFPFCTVTGTEEDEGWYLGVPVGINKTTGTILFGPRFWNLTLPFRKLEF